MDFVFSLVPTRVGGKEGLARRNERAARLLQGALDIEQPPKLIPAASAAAPTAALVVAARVRPPLTYPERIKLAVYSLTRRRTTKRSPNKSLIKNYIAKNFLKDDETLENSYCNRAFSKLTKNGVLLAITTSGNFRYDIT